MRSTGSPQGRAKKFAKSPANASYDKSTTSTNFQPLPRKFNDLAKRQKAGFNGSRFQSFKVAGDRTLNIPPISARKISSLIFETLNLETLKL